MRFLRRSREARRRRALDRRIEAERAQWEHIGEEEFVGLGAPPAPVGLGVPQELVRPGGRESTIWCRYGYCFSKSVIVRDTPDTRTPAWWRRRIVGAFALTVHPFGLAGTKTDAARGQREAISLGTWPATGHVPDLPVGQAPAEVTLQAPAGVAKAHRVGLGSHYVVPPATWAMISPKPQVRPPPDIWVKSPDGRRVLYTLSHPADDGRQTYVVKPRTT